MAKKYTMILVPETHWDREWYSPFQQFRIRLVRLVDKLLGILDSGPEFKSFTFDGQTIVLEDYLHIRPQEREHIKKYVQEGRILVGPWYILPDEFLVSAEATVRNLMIGHQISEEFGRTMKAGYVPDPFGHLSQLPQILTGFGIPSVFFMRGMGEEADSMNTEFWWEAPDGTRILAVNLRNGYFNVCFFGQDFTPEGLKTNMDVAVQQAQNQIDSLGKLASTNYLLLSNGSDHIEPQADLPDIIRYVNEHLKDGEIIHGSYEDYADAIVEAKPKLKTYKGELHRSKFWQILVGVLSTRMYIKQANERTQTLLEKWAEPASAFAWMAGKPYDAQFLWEAWKLCIQNHPHDSICGCSVDQVHREMMPRFEQSQQIGETMTGEALTYIASNVDTTRKYEVDGSQAIVVFNPHAWNVTDTVKVRVEKPLVTGEIAPRYVVKDANGIVVSTHIVNDYVLESDRHRCTWSADVAFTGKDIPSLGYKTYYLEPGDEKATSPLKVSLGSMENDHVRLTVRANGTFDLYHKQTRTNYLNLNLLEDTEDVGDEYNYGWAYNSRTITSEGIGGTLSIVESGPGIGTLRCDLVLNLPESVTHDRLSRSERIVACPVIVYITLNADLPRVDITTVFENNAKDHRLRAHFPTGCLADTVYAEGQYDVVERSLDLPHAEGWCEAPSPQKPVQSFVAVDDTDSGIAVINQGLPEYEAIRAEQCIVAQTLLRCCGWLSRDDYLARPANAGPTIATPEAQCLGKRVFKYAVVPYQINWRKAKVWRYAHQHNAPPKALLTSIHPGELPKAQSFVSISPDNLIVTAAKKAEKSESLVVRVFNTTPEKVEATVSIGQDFKSAHLANLNEEPIDGKLAVHGNSVKFEMPGWRVQTVIFEM